MFKNLITLPHAYLRFVLIRALLLFTVFTGLALATIFVGFFFLYLKLQWGPWHILAVCMGPWLLAVIILAIMTKCAANTVAYKKRNPITLDKNSLLYQVASFAMIFLSRKK